MSKLAASEAYAVAVRVLTDLRQEHGVTQVELARRLGKSQQFVSYFERRERRVDIVEFYAIAKAIGEDPRKAFDRLAKLMPDEVEI